MQYFALISKPNKFLLFRLEFFDSWMRLVDIIFSPYMIPILILEDIERIKLLLIVIWSICASMVIWGCENDIKQYFKYLQRRWCVLRIFISLKMQEHEQQGETIVEPYQDIWLIEFLHRRRQDMIGAQVFFIISV